MPRHLPLSQWRRIQQSVPICCADVLVLQLAGKSRKSIQNVGLIFRHTPHQGDRWCTVGGRVFHNESLAQAVQRQLVETLGTHITFSTTRLDQPTYVVQYFTTKRPHALLDPRQHAIGMTFCVPVEGTPMARGEALSFGWFPPDAIPSARQFGFGQRLVVEQCLKRYAKLR